MKFYKSSFDKIIKKTNQQIRIEYLVTDGRGYEILPSESQLFSVGDPVRVWLSLAERRKIFNSSFMRFYHFEKDLVPLIDFVDGTKVGSHAILWTGKCFDKRVGIQVTTHNLEFSTLRIPRLWKKT
ncbi:MAG: hypothetical protein WD876_02235 [Candidatus Pacearchaeota archaeon]